MKLYLVGGFLGSGKTTAIRQAALYLQQKGRKVGVVTNDQGEQLVDTRFIRQSDIPVEEVTGSCFCCNYQALRKAIESLREAYQPDMIFAESVGSCTDLIATVVKPMLEFDRPMQIVLCVFTDIRLLGFYLQRNKNIFQGRMNYIYEKQLEEADIVVVNKADTLNGAQMHTTRGLIDQELWADRVLYQNSFRREDIERWLVGMDGFQAPPSRMSLSIDYDDYAIGEAEMAWYDSEVEILANDGSAACKAYELIDAVYHKIGQQQYVIGHLKFMLSDHLRSTKISFTTLSGPEASDGKLFGDTKRITLIINARVKASPRALKDMIGKCLSYVRSLTGCTVAERNRKVFSPGYPRPTYRM